MSWIQINRRGAANESMIIFHLCWLHLLHAIDLLFALKDGVSEFIVFLLTHSQRGMDVVRHLLSPHIFLAHFLCVEVHLVLLLVLNKPLLSVKVCLLL